MVEGLGLRVSERAAGAGLMVERKEIRNEA